MKYCGMIGFASTEETEPGIWEEQITERTYYGDVIKNTKRNENSDHLNDNITINNSISIVADPYAYEHFFAIRYASWMGSLWEVSNVEVQRPRLILTLGGMYNGPNQTRSSEDTGDIVGES